MKGNSVRMLVQCGMLIAISIVLSRFFSIRIPLAGVDALRIGFGTFPIVLAGFLFGPWAGAMVGALANLLGALIFPTGAIMPQFIAIAALGGACPIIFWRILGSHRTYFWLLLAIGTSLLINSVGLISFFMNQLYGTPYEFMLTGRLVAWAITAPIYPILLLKVWRYFRNER